MKNNNNTWETKYLQYVSDIHLEMRNDTFPKIIPVIAGRSYLALVGDIGNPNLHIYDNFMAYHSKIFEHILILAGNHEYYSGNTKQFTMNDKEIKLKQALLKETVEEAVAKLDNLKQNELFDFVLKLVKEDDLSGKEVIYVNKKDYSKYLATFSSKKEDELVELDKLNNALGKKFELKLSNKAMNLDGGFYIVSEKYDINHSYSALVDNFLAKLEADLNKILFSEVK